MDRSDNTHGKTSGQNLDEITPAPTRKNPGDLPPIVEDEEEGDIERVDVDSSSQSEPTNEDADVHPRRKKSRAGKDDSQFERISGTNRKNWPGSRFGTLVANTDKIRNLLARNPRSVIFAIIS